MLFDHGTIHISLHKPFRFQMGTNALLTSSEGLLSGIFSPQSPVAVQMGETRSWFGFATKEKWVTVTGLKPGSQIVQWYYESGCCPGATADTHQITFVADKDSASGESILVHKSGFYRGLVAPAAARDNNYKYTNRVQHYDYDRDGPSKEFLFFDEAFRLCDKLFQPQRSSTRGGGLREWFCYLARNSMTGRLPWSEFHGLFPQGTHPGYHNALQRIVQVMRQAMDYGQLRQRELRCLINCAEEVVDERESKVAADADSSDSETESDSASDSSDSNQGKDAAAELLVNTEFFQVKLTPKPKLKLKPKQSEPLRSVRSSEPELKSNVSVIEGADNYVGIWQSVVDRLKMITATVEESIDDLAL